MSSFDYNETNWTTNSKIVIKSTCEKKHLFSYQFKNYFSPKKTVHFLKQIDHTILYSNVNIWNDQLGSDRNMF